MLTLKKVAENYGLTKEGVDYALSQYQIIISEITHGMLSKLSYDAHDVLAYAQDRWCETCELKQPDMTVHEFVEDELPSVPAVPLDKLCEYLNSVIYPCIICKESPGPQCNAKRKGCWNRVLTKWMEGLDDHNGTD